jgi:hypothetical protein
MFAAMKISLFMVVGLLSYVGMAKRISLTTLGARHRVSLLCQTVVRGLTHMIPRTQSVKKTPA